TGVPWKWSRPREHNHLGRNVNAALRVPLLVHISTTLVPACLAREGVSGMVVYNELVAVTAGAGLLGFAAFLTQLLGNKRIDSEGWAAFFGVSGLLLFVLGVHTTVTWPFGGAPFEYANIAFGQPAAGFGALMLL